MIPLINLHLLPKLLQLCFPPSQRSNQDRNITKFATAPIHQHLEKVDHSLAKHSQRLVLFFGFCSFLRLRNSTTIASPKL